MKKTFRSSREVIIRTNSWAEATKFYKSVLGLPVAHRSKTMLGFETGAFCLYVEKGERARAETRVPCARRPSRQTQARGRRLHCPGGRPIPPALLQSRPLRSRVLHRPGWRGTVRIILHFPFVSLTTATEAEGSVRTKWPSADGTASAGPNSVPTAIILNRRCPPRVMPEVASAPGGRQKGTWPGRSSLGRPPPTSPQARYSRRVFFVDKRDEERLVRAAHAHTFRFLLDAPNFAGVKRP